MKVALLLIGVLVCASMTEATSVRRAKNHFRAMLKRQYNPTFTWTTPPKPKAPVTTTKAPVTTTTAPVPWTTGTILTSSKNNKKSVD